VNAINDAFGILLERILPTEAETARLQQHRRTIQTRLSDTLGIADFVKVGSVMRGTSIRGDSDLDLLAKIPRDGVRWGRRTMTSGTVLSNVRAELLGRYPNTDIGRDVHAVVVSFGGASVDVVPAFFQSFDSRGHPVFRIPDGRDGWLDTSPGLHDAFIAEANRASGGKLYNVARLVKFWRSCRQARVPISSFHIEIVLAHERICSGVKSYADCFTEALQSLARRECRALHDPLGISGSIRCCPTEAQRAGALDAVCYSREKAKLALEAARWNTTEARRYWNMVFNGYFPA
jgi:predicted nucleotidyltransferase